METLDLVIVMFTVVTTILLVYVSVYTMYSTLSVVMVAAIYALWFMLLLYISYITRQIIPIFIALIIGMLLYFIVESPELYNVYVVAVGMVAILFIIFAGVLGKSYIGEGPAGGRYLSPQQDRVVMVKRTYRN